MGDGGDRFSFGCGVEHPGVCPVSGPGSACCCGGCAFARFGDDFAAESESDGESSGFDYAASWGESIAAAEPDG
jgi:hypothetical protein